MYEVGIAIKATEDLSQVSAQAGNALNNLSGSGRNALDALKASWLELSAAAYAAYQTLSKAMEFVSLGAKAQQAEESFRRVAESYHINAEKMIADLRRLSGETIDDSELMQKAIKSLTQGLEEGQIKRLMEIARVEARRTGEDVGATFELLNDAIANQLPKSLRQMGLITKEQMGLINKAMAAGIDDVKLFDLISANAALHQAALGEVHTNNAEKLQRLHTIWEQTKESIGVGLLNLIDGAKNFGKAIAEFIVKGMALAIRGVFELAVLAETALNKVGIVSDERLAKDKATLDQLRNFKVEFAQTGEQAIKTGMSVAEAKAQIDKLMNDMESKIGAAEKAKKAEETAQKIIQLNDQIQDQIDQMTLTPIQSIQKQADEWIKLGADRVKVEEWVNWQIEQLGSEHQSKITAQNEEADLRELARKKEFHDAQMQFIQEEADFKVQKYQDSYQMMFDMANQIGGETGKGLGMMVGGMKGITDIQQGVDPYTEEYNRTAQHYADLIQAKIDYYGQSADIEAEWQGIMLAQDQMSQQQRFSVYANYTGMIMGVIGMLSSFIGGNNKTLFLLQKAAAIAITLVNAHAASVAALAPPPMGLGPILGIPLAAKMLTFGYINAAIIAATAIGQMAAGSKGANIPSAGGGFSYNHPSQPRFERDREKDEDKDKREARIFQIEIKGYTDPAEVARVLAPFIDEAQGDKVSYGL